MLSLYAIHLLVRGLCKKGRRGKSSFTHFSLVPNSASAFRNLIALNIIPRTWLWMTVQHTRPLFATAYSTLDVMFLRQTKETNRTPCQCTDESNCAAGGISYMGAMWYHSASQASFYTCFMCYMWFRVGLNTVNITITTKSCTIMKKILNKKHYKLLLTINMSVV